MISPTKTPHPVAAMLPQAGATPPSSIGSTSSRAHFIFPKLGDEVRFRRSPTHQPECGIVRGRQFGTRIVEVVDMCATPLRLEPDQYELVSP